MEELKARKVEVLLTLGAGDIDQLVILGAGWDTRSYRMPKEIHCFEVDLEKTQQIKRQMLKKAGLDTTRITFVPADFMQEDWLEKLVHAGLDPDKPTFFLWEGVTMYLDREAVESMLCKIASTKSGSAVAFDYFHADFLQARSLYWRYARALANAAGEHANTDVPGGRAKAFCVPASKTSSVAS